MNKKNYRYFRLFVMIFQSYHGDEVAMNDDYRTDDEDDEIKPTSTTIDLDKIEPEGSKDRYIV